MTTVTPPLELIGTSHLMRTQSNRHTQFPLFIIQELQEVPKPAGCGNERKYFSSERQHELTVEQYDVIESWQDEPEQADEVGLMKLLEDIGYDALDEVDLSEYREVEYDTEWVYRDDAGVFFTEKACQMHIDENYYHYNKPRTFVISAWRNPEMVMMMQLILKLTGEEIPSCYR